MILIFCTVIVVVDGITAAIILIGYFDNEKDKTYFHSEAGLKVIIPIDSSIFCVWLKPYPQLYAINGWVARYIKTSETPLRT